MDGLFKKNIADIDPSGAEYTPVSDDFDTTGDDMLPSYYNAFSL